MDDYTPTDQVSVTDGAGAAQNTLLCAFFRSSLLVPTAAGNGAYHTVPKYSLAVCLMGTKEAEAL